MKTFRISVTKQTAKKVVEMLYKLGYCWYNGNTNYVPLKYGNTQYAVDGRYITFSPKSYYDEQSLYHYPEITFEELEEMVSELK